MLPNTTTNPNASEDDAIKMFCLLTEENKEKVIRFIAGLKEKQ